MSVATPKGGMGTGREGGPAVSSLHFPLALPPIAATQQHPQMSNTACRGEKDHTQNPLTHLMHTVLQNTVSLSRVRLQEF